jgi:beta-lactamase regulating signal transducer with metallopeptidase domain
MSFAFLIQMGWKSALIAGAALVILRLLRSRSAADRAAMLQLAVAMLLLLPAISAALPSLQVVQPLPLAAVEPAPAMAAPSPLVTAAPIPLPAMAEAPRALPSLPLPLVLALTYAAGVALLLGRMAAGLVTLAGWTRRGVAVAAPEWTGALARVRAAAGVRAPVRLLASASVPSPLSWGLLRPVILVDAASLARPQDAGAILAHEIAHVARRDWLVLMASQLAVALFWFNPLVWRLERALVQAAEEAADRRAIEGVEPLSYASTLLACVRHAGAGRAVPANGMAPRRALKARVEAILDPERRGRASGSVLTAAAMGLCVAVAGPVAALELVAPEPPAPPAASRAAIAPPAPLPPARPAPAVRETRPAHARRDLGRDPQVDPTPEEEDAIDRAVELAMAGTEVRIPEIRVPEIYIPQIDIPEIRIPEVRIPEQRVRIPPIDRAAVREAARAEARVQRQRITPEQIFGITPERKQAYAQLGYPDLPQKQLVAMAIHGVTPQYIRDMAGAGYPGVSPDTLVQMRIFGVTPAAARRAAQTQGRPSPEELIKMKIFGTL